MENVQDQKGLLHREVRLLPDGRLKFIGHDLGDGVEEFFGVYEYEFERTLSADEVAQLRTLLGVSPEGDLIGSIRARFASSFDFSGFLKEHNLEGEYWSRLGD